MTRPPRSQAAPGYSGTRASEDSASDDRASEDSASEDSARADGASGDGGGAQGDQPRRRPDPWKAVFFGVLVVAVLAGAGWAVLGSSLLVVRHVAVTGNRLVTAAQVRQAADIRTGAPLATVNTAAAAGRVERLAPVLSATVRRSWPDGIVITVRERTAVLAVPLIGGGFELVDEDGVVVAAAAKRPAGLAELSAPPAALRGNPAVRAAAMVLRHLPRALRRRLVSVSATGADAVTLHLNGRVTVLWGGAGQSAHKAAELELLLGRHARYYDVSDPATVVTQG